jgi:hypothetical protein
LACIISESSCEEVADEDVYTTYDLDDAEDQCEDEIEDYYECLDKGSSSLYDDYDSD